ncbi:MAG TPA: hypothetical protein VF533_22100 [Solirubrobacteraceae bacterium]
MPAGDLLALPGIARLAGEPGVHAVGGAVRDVLLGREPVEVDLVVEGDAIALARRIGTVVAVHERFGTATVAVDGTRLDLASARRERYAAPGALPDVELGATIEEDLRRRDFTINAMAVRLADQAVTAVPGAIDDLRGSLLRVLHLASFRDDPTRLLRLARYGARLGFVPEPGTAALGEAAVYAGAVGTVTPGRLGAELRLLLSEPQPAALLELERWGLGAALLGDRFRVDAGCLRRALDLRPDDARADLVALAACGADPERLQALGYAAREAAIVRAAGGAGSERDAVEAAEGTDRVLSSGPLEAAVLVAARGGPQGDAARSWLAETRHRRLAITGDDLVAAGLRGPAVGAALAAARAAMIAGRAPDRERQLAVALGA